MHEECMARNHCTCDPLRIFIVHNSYLFLVGFMCICIRLGFNYRSYMYYLFGECNARDVGIVFIYNILPLYSVRELIAFYVS